MVWQRRAAVFDESELSKIFVASQDGVLPTCFCSPPPRRDGLQPSLCGELPLLADNVGQERYSCSRCISSFLIFSGMWKRNNTARREGALKGKTRNTNPIDFCSKRTPGTPLSSLRHDLLNPFSHPAGYTYVGGGGGGTYIHTFIHSYIQNRLKCLRTKAFLKTKQNRVSMTW